MKTYSDGCGWGKLDQPVQMCGELSWRDVVLELDDVLVRNAYGIARRDNVGHFVMDSLSGRDEEGKDEALHVALHKYSSTQFILAESIAYAICRLNLLLNCFLFNNN